jgi:hypothetical protein
MRIKCLILFPIIYLAFIILCLIYFEEFYIFRPIVVLLTFPTNLIFFCVKYFIADIFPRDRTYILWLGAVWQFFVLGYLFDIALDYLKNKKIN